MFFFPSNIAISVMQFTRVTHNINTGANDTYMYIPIAPILYENNINKYENQMIGIFCSIYVHILSICETYIEYLFVQFSFTNA